ncbi:PREDICTED: dolichyl-diphosphooligosaccharide--protein glycosyltransferase subunit 2-like [Nelumbo nucifera]|uniref:Dolichyl-diphosphooligosaccharide--protein glycosyltransferase subunit 2 n=2 Tax=Nelumbo nucifera TaxID=4432 RepID=A0A1U8AC34_NELNU|nr:PREDICTED: dolichyl-diphosphooligosaccharide--protein glycosyltransferase subunit 2-like [Nelumbo nucifera]DAD19937.1 TPA_asm: hypothetical protein HUJ06_021400 [Nelumbo nucifera]
MARNIGFMVPLLLSLFICEAAIFRPITDSHRSAALELFMPDDGSYGSLEEIYEALRTFQILGIEKNVDLSRATCLLIVEKLSSSSSSTKDLFYALRVNSILKCDINAEVFEGTISKLQTIIKDANSLLDFYHSIGGLVLMKGEDSKINVHLADADGVLHSIKALSQSDGRWHYSSNSNIAESSTYAAGIALETIAGIVSLASSEVDQSMIATVKNDITKLFDSVESYGDGALYFDDKLEDQGTLSTTSSVVRGVTSFASVTSGRLNLPGDKIVGLAKFFLGIGVPGTAKDLFDQLDSLACLEKNSVAIPLILSLPATVLSLTKNDHLKVKVNTVLGSNSPPLTVRLVRVFRSDSKETSVVENQELKFDPESSVHSLDVLPQTVDVGKYICVFEVVHHDPDNEKMYATGGQSQVPIYITGLIKIDSAEITILDSDVGSIETKQKLDFSGETAVSLSANHLQKLRLSFQMTTPLGNAFKPHQAFLKLIHESKVEHIFVLGNSGKQFEIILDFLGLVDRLYYLSGRYDIQLTIGDASMENSFLWALGHVDLDLPEAPEKAKRPPPQPADPYMRYGPKQEITHIFRLPEKRPPQDLSLAFLALTLLPLIGFLAGLLRLGVNLKNFPGSAVPATFAILFHVGIAAVLLLYVLFWLKFNLFTTLKLLGFLGAFLLFVGHRTLSYLASTSAKLKSA